jgi:ABC-type multidrug transport system ATPase subunit
VRIVLNKISKRYNDNWIFKNINYEFTSDHAYVIKGGNGSGKSTLLQLISGNLTPSEGTLNYYLNTSQIRYDQVYANLSMQSPSMDLIDVFTMREIISFHFRFKGLYPGISIQKVIDIIDLDESHKKPLKEFSSGMKQRVKLALAILSDTQILLLDEPTGSLDKNGINWYNQMMNKYRKNRLVIVCSNQIKEEYSFCNKELTVEDYKIFN